MKKPLPFMLFVFALIALGAACLDEDPASDVPDTECTGEDAAFEDIYLERGPAPEIPEGPMWEMMGTQMATLRETQALVRESLLNKDMFTVMVCGSSSPLPTTPGAQACTAFLCISAIKDFGDGDS